MPFIRTRSANTSPATRPRTRSPLYALGRRCGGNFRYLENGVKDCSACLFPHCRENYDKVNARFSELVELTRE